MLSKVLEKIKEKIIPTYEGRFPVVGVSFLPPRLVLNVKNRIVEAEVSGELRRGMLMGQVSFSPQSRFEGRIVFKGKGWVIEEGRIIDRYNAFESIIWHLAHDYIPEPGYFLLLPREEIVEFVRKRQELLYRAMGSNEDVLSEIEKQTLEYMEKAHIARLKAIDEDFARRYGTVSKKELLTAVEKALKGNQSWEEWQERFVPYKTAEEVVKELEQRGYSREKVVRVLRRFFVSRLWLNEFSEHFF